MNWAHVHLLLNHVPVLGTIFGVVLLAVALLRRSDVLTKTSFAVFIVSALIAVPVYFTGESAQNLVKRMAGIQTGTIESHEEIALLSLLAVMLLGAVAFAGVLISLRHLAVPRRLATTAFALSLIVTGLMARTAQLGGRIHHTEIGAGAVAPAATPNVERFRRD